VGEAVVGAFRQAAITAGVLIVLLLSSVLRRLLDVALVLAPLGIAILVTVALTVLFTTPFNLANIIVLPLVLGLGVAFGIQIVLRHRSDGDGAFMETSTPRAVVFSALTTIGSFGALAISKHPGTASMGFLLMLSISLTMLCTLLVLPALLELFSGNRRRADHRPTDIGPKR
jgi:predicted RND superfamily exporter protein